MIKYTIFVYITMGEKDKEGTVRQVGLIIVVISLIIISFDAHEGSYHHSIAFLLYIVTGIL